MSLFEARTASDLARSLEGLGERGREHTIPAMTSSYEEELSAWVLRHPTLRTASEHFGLAQFQWRHNRSSEEAWQRVVDSAREAAAQLRQFGDEMYPKDVLADEDEGEQ